MNSYLTRKGLVFIPDISGFTELVRSTDLLTGKRITYELLSTIIQHNVLGLEIAEIEGDAVFFYKWRQLPSIEDITRQFDSLTRAFCKKKAELEAQLNLPLDLHLKAVAHYGSMSEFSLGGFRKLYGEVVIESHRLLKNGIPGRSYLLMTDELTAAAPAADIPATHSTDGSRSNALCEIYGDIRNICFTYLQFDHPVAVAT